MKKVIKLALVLFHYETTEIIAGALITWNRLTKVKFCAESEVVHFYKTRWRNKAWKNNNKDAYTGNWFTKVLSTCNGDTSLQEQEDKDFNKQTASKSILQRA